MHAHDLTINTATAIDGGNRWCMGLLCTSTGMYSNSFALALVL